MNITTNETPQYIVVSPIDIEMTVIGATRQWCEFELLNF
jgi:hypothetical protein